MIYDIESLIKLYRSIIKATQIEIDEELMAKLCAYLRSFGSSIKLADLKVATLAFIGDLQIFSYINEQLMLQYSTLPVVTLSEDVIALYTTLAVHYLNNTHLFESEALRAVKNGY